MNRNFYALVFLALLVSFYSRSQCVDITLSTQAQVDNYKITYGCSNITGTLRIQNTDITHLDSLYSITHVGALIVANTGVTTLRGLHHLNRVDHALTIQNNASITDLGGLEGLTFVSAELNVDGNPSLQSVNGVSALTYVGTLSLTGNDALTDLEVFSSLRRTSYLYLSRNTSLPNLHGLRNLTSLKELIITKNPALTDLGLVSLDSVDQGITITNNNALVNLGGLPSLRKAMTIVIRENPALTNINLPALTALKTLRIESSVMTNLDGFASLKRLDTELWIADNSELVNIDGLGGITSPDIENIYLSNNHKLVSVNGLSHIRTIARDFYCSSNYALADLTGLSSLQQVNGSFFIATAMALQSLHGLESLTTAGRFEIDWANNLTNLDGLSALTTVQGAFELENNDALASISALNNLKTIGGGLSIHSCRALPNLDGLEHLTSVGVNYDGPFSLQIEYNDRLENIRALTGLTTLIDRLSIHDNRFLKSLQGLDNLRSVKSIYLATNGIKNVDALAHITEIPDGGLTISFCPITNLDGLSNLTSIRATNGAALVIQANTSLLNIDGLSRLARIEGAQATLTLQDNLNLKRCCGLYKLLHNNGVHGTSSTTINIINNGAGCTAADIEAGGPCTAPNQPTNLVFSQVTENSMRVSFTAAGDATARYLVLMRTGQFPYPTDKPQAGVTYTKGQTIGQSLVVSTEHVINFPVTDLQPNTIYYFDVYVYDTDLNYDTTNPLEGTQKTIMPPASGLSFTAVTSESIHVSFAPDSVTPAGYLVVMKAYGAPASPQDGTQYQVGNLIGSSTIVVGKGSALGYDIVYLQPSTPYYFAVYAFDNTSNYHTRPAVIGNQSTTAEDAGGAGDSLAQPTNLVFSNITDNSMTVSFTGASTPPTGYIAVMRAYGSPFPSDKPTDGVAYSVGSTIGSSTIVVGFGTSTTLNVIYLQANTDYYFDVISYNYNSDSGYNYLTDGPLVGHQATGSGYGTLSAAEQKDPAYPNPFVESVTIPFVVEQPHTMVHIIIYDQLGRTLSTFTREVEATGTHEVTWDRTDLAGRKMDNGIYMYRVKGHQQTETFGRLVAK